MVKSILITRPIDQSIELAELLKLKGYHPYLSPLLDIKPHPFDPHALQYADFYIATSIHALDAASKSLFCRLSTPLFVVGDHLKEKALKLGFKDVTSASGNAQDLEALIIQTAPKGSALLYLRGEDISYDLEASLRQKGYETGSLIVYQSAPLPLTSAALSLIENDKIDYVSLFSNKTAQFFLNEIAPLKKAYFPLMLITLSPKITHSIEASALNFSKILTCSHPDVTEFVAVLENSF